MSDQHVVIQATHDTLSVIGWLKSVLQKETARMGGGCNWLELCPTAGFDIDCVESSGSATKE